MFLLLQVEPMETEENIDLNEEDFDIFVRE
jgi:hypothetical protein